MFASKQPSRLPILPTAAGRLAPLAVISIFATLLLAIHVASASEDQTKADLYVSPAGNDNWSGRLPEPNADRTDGPLATLAAARDTVRKLKADSPQPKPILVLLRGGTYGIGEPVVFTAADSGSEQAPITYAAWPGEKPVISGGVPIGGWKKADDGRTWKTTLPEVRDGNWYFRQLWIGGRRATPARTPNQGYFRSAGPGKPYKNRREARGDRSTKLSIHYQDQDLKPWKNLDEAIVVIYHSWTASRHRIKSLDTQNKLVEFTAPSGWPMGYWEKDQRYFVEFVPEALDVPGEWYLDRRSGELSYIAREGEDLDQLEVIAARPSQLVKLDGDAASGKLISDLRFEGISFRHTSWTMPEARTVDGQAAASLPEATVFCTGARRCAFVDCEIAATGGYALWLSRGSKDNRVERCHIHDMAGGGVRLGETSLPKEPQLQAERNEVLNCFVHDGGNVFHAAVGVWLGRTSHNKVQHNEISDFYYTGVSVGWSWGYAPSTANHNSIEHNHIHHLGWGELSDMGGIYCLGLSPGTKLCHNVIHDVCSYSYGGWGLYTDEGSSQILMENNIVYRVKDGAFHQHYGRENTLRNNVLALSATYGQVRRSRQEEHSSFTIERNIIYGDGVPMLGGHWSNDNFTLRDNCYWDTSGQPPKFPGGLTLEQWQTEGHDAGSIVADPLFVAPKQANFALRPNSPAIEKLGFEPIDTSSVGLQGPEAWVRLPEQYSLPKMQFPAEKPK